MASLLHMDMPLESRADRAANCRLSVASFIAFVAKTDHSHVALGSLPPAYRSLGSPDARMKVAYEPRSNGGYQERAPAIPRILVLGDDFEVDEYAPSRPVGNAALVTLELAKGYLEALTSIPGLPALYLGESSAGVLLMSDLFLLRYVAGWPLQFDPAGISDLAWIGRPVEHRTLFRGIRIVPGGSKVVLAQSGRFEVSRRWHAPGRLPSADWNEYTARQAETFRQSIRRLNVRDCVLSLSSGIDSRTTLAGLIENGARVRALTVSGERCCLDARTAAALCAAYDLEHQTIKLDRTFRAALPELSAEACLRSGGISSVWHAAQIHCYRQLGDPPPYGALSGYLGNQIGRCGTEGLTPRGTDTGFLDRGLVVPAHADKSWYADAMTPDGFLDRAFLVQQESTFGNLASYSIGNTYSVQQSAYACRPLIENLWLMPTTTSGIHRGLKVRNLKHLFLGESAEASFQRRYVNSIGGVVAHYPVNWGWRTQGGLSFRGVAWGLLALTDALVSARFSESGAAYKLASVAGVAGLHEFRPVNEWMRGHMRSFVYDEVLSSKVRAAGVFDMASVQRTLDHYFRAGRGSKQVVLALDLALATRLFGATA